MGKAERDNKAFTDAVKLGAYDVSINIEYSDGSKEFGIYAKRWVHNGPFLALHGLTEDMREQLTILVMQNIKKCTITPIWQDKKIEVV